MSRLQTFYYKYRNGWKHNLLAQSFSNCNVHTDPLENCGSRGSKSLGPVNGDWVGETAFLPSS